MADVTAFCGNCGHPLTAQDRFCGACGTPVPAGAPPAQTGAVEVPAKAQDLPDASARTPDLASTSIPRAAPAFPALNRRLVIGVVAVLGVIAVVGGGIAVGVGIGSAGRDDSVASAPDTSEVVVDDIEEPEADAPATTEPAASPTPPPSEPSTTPVEFTSQSGNIRCRMATDGVVCHQGEHTYAKPSQACKSGPKGVTVGLNQSGITWPCLSSDIVTGYVLPYDTIITAHGYDCIITYLTGVTCTNQDLFGFQMEYDLGVKSVQY